MTRRERAESDHGLAVELPCPKCGAAFDVVDERAVSETCRFCGSLLILSHPRREEIYVARGVVASARECFEICVEYRVQAERAQIVSRFADSEGNPPPEFLIQSRLRAFETRLRERARLHEGHEIHVPYWHVTGKVVQAILGRVSDIKQTRIRAFLVEHTVPGYDTTRANLRDRGLRLARSRVRPLTVQEASGSARYLPWIPVPVEPYREIDKWLKRRLDPGIQPMIQEGRFLFGQRILLYRPYWLLRVSLDAAPRWVLLDGSFSTVAGHPSELEVEDLLVSCVDNPLPEGVASHLQTAATASRCPDCGAERRFDPQAIVSICSNCRLGLQPCGESIRVVGYDHAPGRGSVEYLPFWRFPFRAVLPAGGATLQSLEEYAAALFPLGAPPRFGLRGRHLWIPAFRLLGTAAGDATFKALVELLHATPPRANEGKVPLGTTARFWSCSVPEQHAADLAPFALVALHSKTSAARLNNLVFRQKVQDVRLHSGGGRLVMVPFSRSGNELSVPGTGARVPLLVLQGGPELEAQRATVQSALGG
jgi:hypothetical protein